MHQESVKGALDVAKSLAKRTYAEQSRTLGMRLVGDGGGESGSCSVARLGR